MKSYVRKSYKLPELFDMYMGKTPDRNNPEYWENGTHPWISIADMTSNGKLVTHTKECITDKAIRETGIKPINYNTVIMSFKLSVGKVSKVATVSTPAYSNEAIMAFEIPPVPVGSPMILNDYAYYLLQSLDFTNTGNKAVMGKTLNKAILQNTIVNVHIDLKVQSEIVSVLDKITALIDKRREQLETLDELVKARFVELFGDCKNLVAMNDLCSIITDGTHQPPKFQSEGIPFIFVSNLANNTVTYNAEKFISEETYNDLIKRTPIEIGDILLTTVGSYGHPAVVVEERKFLFQRHIAYLKPKHDLVNSFYLHSALLAPNGQRQIEEKIKGIAQKTLNLSEIRKIIIPIPSIEEQNAFELFIKQTNKSKLTVQKTIVELEALKKSLMQKYFG
ncbi:MAG: restriction endonuclease subunit S [Clostridia bacterium]|nr:restriction endonuclease subunit S [Clostridia bacterium]